MKEIAQSQLTLTLERLAEGAARSWVGPKPVGGSLIPLLTAQVGLDAHGREADFIPLSQNDAPIWLMLFATQSLLHGNQTIALGIQEELSECLRFLGPEARFFSKGVWQQTRRHKHYEPVSFESGWDRRRHRLVFQRSGDPLAPIDVLTDGGLVGFDNDTAFIFWVEEDD